VILPDVGHGAIKKDIVLFFNCEQNFAYNKNMKMINRSSCGSSYANTTSKCFSRNSFCDFYGKWLCCYGWSVDGMDSKCWGFNDIASFSWAEGI